MLITFIDKGPTIEIFNLDLIKMKIKCTICKKKFIATRKWSKYCSDKCRKNANISRVVEYRKKNQPLKINNLDQLRYKEPYKKNYENIINAIKLLNQSREAGYKVTWNNLLKKTGLSSDSLNKYLNIMRKFGVIEKNSYELSDKFKLEPFRILQTDIINNTSIDNILPINNNALYLRCLTYEDFTEEEIITLLSYLYEINDYYSKIECDILMKAGKRKANIIWNEFIDNIEANKPIKFLMWLLLIGNNIEDDLGSIIILSGWSKINKPISGRNFSEIHDIFNQMIKIQQKTINEIYNEITLKQQKQFKIIFRKAYYTYLKKFYPDTEKLNELIKVSEKKYSKRFEEKINQIRGILLDSRLFLAIKQNELISWADIQYGYNFDKEKTDNILTGLSYAKNDHPFSKKIDQIGEKLIKEKIKLLKNKSIEEITSEDLDIPKIKNNIKNNEESTFFSDIDFFSGFEEELETQINCDKKILYEYMDRFGNIFDRPLLSNKINV